MRAPMPPPSEPAALSPIQMETIREVPSGAATLSGIAVLLLLGAWLLIYFLIYLPRGMVG